MNSSGGNTNHRVPPLFFVSVVLRDRHVILPLTGAKTVFRIEILISKPREPRKNDMGVLSFFLPETQAPTPLNQGRAALYLTAAENPIRRLLRRQGCIRSDPLADIPKERKGFLCSPMLRPSLLLASGSSID